MALKFYKDFNIQPKADSGGTSGIPASAINLYKYNSEFYEYLCTWNDITNITATSENSWQGTYNNDTLEIWLETDAFTGDYIVKMSYGANYDDVKIGFGADYIVETLPSFEV